MRKRIRRVVRTAAAGMVAAMSVAMAPCESSLQHPPANTELCMGVAIAWPKVDITAPHRADLEAVGPAFAVEDIGRSCE